MRPIDADVLTHKLKTAIDIGKRHERDTSELEAVLSDVEMMPTIDAVPVIRCKECKYWLPHEQFGFDADNDEYHNYCERLVPDDDYYALTREADDYCSRAERKED